VLPATGGYLRAALDFTETLTDGLGFTEAEQKEVRLAIEEILCFVQRVALIGENAQPVTIAFEPQADGLVVRITEKGLPLDIENLPEYQPTSDPREQTTEGLSIFLVKKAMDRVVFQNRGREGLEVELLKHRASSHVSQLAGEQPGEDAAREPLPVQQVDYAIRPARESEALEIARCAYLTYGYTYEDYIYYPERINEMNSSGELCSLVAVSEDDAVMGHCALKFAEGRPERAELGVLFVNPAYRGNGVGAALWSATVAKARELGLESIFARSVTGHRASQTMAERNGFCDCALSLALFPRAVDLKAMGGLQAGKMSGMMQWLKLRPPRTRTVDMPGCYRDIASDLYRRAGITVEDLDQFDAGSSAEPLYRVRRIAVLNVGILEIESTGRVEAATQWIDVTCRRLCREKLDVVYLYVNIEQAGAARVVEHCRRHGYILSGIAPGAFAGGDALALQYLNLPEDPFAGMTVWTDTATLLRDFILKEWQELEQH
jgi:serine/threonine-protein kinase RsbW